MRGDAGAFMLNSGDAGLLRSLNKIAAAGRVAIGQRRHHRGARAVRAIRPVADEPLCERGRQPLRRREVGRGVDDVIGSIAHLAYHLGAIRQINKDARGPREGTF